MLLNKTKFITTKGIFFSFLLLPGRNKLFLRWTCCLLTPSLLLCLPCLQLRSLRVHSLCCWTSLILICGAANRGPAAIQLTFLGQARARHLASLWDACFTHFTAFTNSQLLCYHSRDSEWKWKLLSRVLLFPTPWTQQFMKFSRTEHWSG